MKKIETVIPQNKVIAVRHVLMQEGVLNARYCYLYSFSPQQAATTSCRGSQTRNAKARLELIVDDSNVKAVTNAIRAAVGFLPGDGVFFHCSTFLPDDMITAPQCIA